MAPDLKFTNAKQLVANVLRLDFFTEPKPPIPYIWTASKAKTPLVVVTGENAGGKSFFRRCVQSICQQQKTECMTISMEGRRQTSYNIALVFVYGDEEYEATGINSIRTVLTGIKTCQGRDKAHVVVWDEPDIGLSEGNAASVGKAIADYTTKPSAHTKASIVITHRKALVAELASAQPHFLYLGDREGPRTVQAWLDAPPVVRPLEEIEQRSRTRFKGIQKILDDLKKR